MKKEGKSVEFKVEFQVSKSGSTYYVATFDGTTVPVMRWAVSDLIERVASKYGLSKKVTESMKMQVEEAGYLKKVINY